MNDDNFDPDMGSPDRYEDTHNPNGCWAAAAGLFIVFCFLVILCVLDWLGQ